MTFINAEMEVLNPNANQWTFSERQTHGDFSIRLAGHYLVSGSWRWIQVAEKRSQVNDAPHVIEFNKLIVEYFTKEKTKKTKRIDGSTHYTGLSVRAYQHRVGNEMKQRIGFDVVAMGDTYIIHFVKQPNGDVVEKRTEKASWGMLKSLMQALEVFAETRFANDRYLDQNPKAGRGVVRSS